MAEENPDDGETDDATPPSDEADPGSGPSDARNVTLDGTADDETFWSSYGTSRRSERYFEESLTRGRPHRVAIQDISRAELREHYGPLRTLFKQYEGSYASFQHQLAQARIDQTYDRYLTTVVRRSLAIVALSVVLGILVGVGLLGAARYGVMPRVLADLGLAAGTLAGLVVGASVLVGATGGVLYWAWYRVVRLRQLIAYRRREINYNLPFAVTFMYALSRAGVRFDRIVTRLADSTETYGAAAEEFDQVVRDMEMFGNNLYVGLENLRLVTPSEELYNLTDDIITVLETGGDMAAFLRDEVDDQLETAVASQETFIEQLELLSEVFVVGIVAAPLFVLVVLIVISFLGAETVTIIALLVYVGVPLALVAFAIIVDVVGQPFDMRASFSTADRGTLSPPTGDSTDPDWRAAYERDKQRADVRTRLRNQLLAVRDEPWRALLFSVPVALAVPVAGVVIGLTPLSFGALLENPVELTTGLVVAPVVIATTPVALVHEYRHRQELAFQRQFPDLLELLATSNRRGLALTRSLDIVANNTSGRLGEELQRLRNDIRWNADLPDAFEAFGDRLNSPSLTRTANLIAEGSRATSDLYAILDVAATDTASRARLARERRQTLQSYLVIVLIGFLVYLLVIVLLAGSFLDPIEAFSASTEAVETGPISPAGIPVSRLRVMLFHSALIQGFGSGVLAGMLAENSAYSGLKYGLGLVVLTVAIFMVI